LRGFHYSVTIPAITLQLGQSYLATLSLAHILTINYIQYLLVPGTTAYASSTDVNLRMVSVPILTITNAAGASVTYTDSNSAPMPARFYRVQEP
jgi:hypothetical protein